jgi:acetyl esterase/lipase
VALFNLILAAIMVASVIVTFVPIRRDPLTGTSFVAGWIIGELAGQLTVLFIIIVAIVSSFGGTTGHLGRIALVLDVVAVLGLVVLTIAGFTSQSSVERSLAATPGLPLEIPESIRRPKWGRWWRVVRSVPVPSSDLEIVKNVAYVNDGNKAHRLDIIKSKHVTEGAPVLLYIHGGAWVIGDKREQGKPMMFELAARGWVCVTANYRLSPKATWPDHIVDVMAAIAWVKRNIADYGGDASFLAISGGSAGGHLCALAGLANGDPAFQPGFEDADTSVDACVPIYGVLDMTAQHDIGGRYGSGLRILLEKQVMRASIDEQREIFEQASPLHRIHADAPPFLVVHGANDTLVPVAVPRAFVPALRRVSRQPVGYIELPLAQHAFDVLASPRCSAATRGIITFLEAIRARQELPGT